MKTMMIVKMSDSSPLGEMDNSKGLLLLMMVVVELDGWWRVRLVMMQRSAGRFSMK